MIALRRKLLGSLFVAGVMMGVIAAPSHAQVTIKHAKGELTLKAVPKKVVVYDLAVLDNMKALGEKAVAVPKLAAWPEHLAEYNSASMPTVGSLFEPDYEKVLAAAPDLIIIAGRSAPKYDDLSKIAPTIDLTTDPKDLIGSVKNNVRTLGAVFNKKDKAESLLADLDKNIADLNKKAEKVNNGMLLLTVGNKMSVYGPGSRFGLLHDAFGIKPTVKDLQTTTHGQAASFEYLYKTNPEWLFVIDRDTAIGTAKRTPHEALDNELMHKTAVWKNKRIVYLNASNWYVLGSAGYTSLNQNIAQLDRALSAN
jgi:iron complex transport system substrate-binding protein